MFNLPKIRRSYRRAILVYLIAIVTPTLVFLYLGLQSVQRKRQAISSLTASNLRLSGEKLAAELERRVWQLAEACLRDGEFAQLRLGSDGTLIPEEAKEIRILLQKVEKRHPMAHHFFVLQGNAVRFPLLRTPAHRQIESYIGRQADKTGERFANLFAEGEDWELRQQRPDQALAFYRESYKLSVSDWLKALALARVARCWQKMDQAKAAEQAYHTLGERYGNQYDVFHRPYALIAALESDDLAKNQGKPSSISFADLYRDLVRGRWEISADQIDHFLASIKERMEAPLTKLDKTEYLGHFGTARVLQEGFRHYGPLHLGEVYANAFSRGETKYQTFYTPLADGQGAEALVGFTVDLDWIENQLLPQSRSELQVDEDFAMALNVRQDAVSYANGVGVDVTFKNLFPFWQLSIAPGAVEAWKATARRDMLVFAGSMILILGVLILGVVLLMRDVSRELKLSQLRGDFISGVSHELKTPLTLIRLYAETLLHGKHFGQKQRQDFYQIITRESERLSHLIEKVLDFSRIDRGQKQYNLQEGKLAQVVRRTVEVYGEYLQRQGFSVETDLATHLPPVRFDPDAVSEAILNLMDNAAKYSGESKFVGVRLRPEDNQVIFEVEDHGIGIPASEHEKIFQQFYRTRSESGKGGYGIGLFLVKHIMDAHGGKIELDSEPEHGSWFRLIFPVSAPSTA